MGGGHGGGHQARGHNTTAAMPLGYGSAKPAPCLGGISTGAYITERTHGRDGPKMLKMLKLWARAVDMPGYPLRVAGLDVRGGKVVCTDEAAFREAVGAFADWGDVTLFPAEALQRRATFDELVAQVRKDDAIYARYCEAWEAVKRDVRAGWRGRDAPSEEDVNAAYYRGLLRNLGPARGDAEWRALQQLLSRRHRRECMM